MSCLFCSHCSSCQWKTKNKSAGEDKTDREIKGTLINSTLSLSLCNLLGFGEADLHLNYFKQCYFCISCRDQLVKLSVFQQQVKQLENDIQCIKNDFEASLGQTYKTQRDHCFESERKSEQNYGSNFTNCVRKALVQELNLINDQKEDPKVPIKSNTVQCQSEDVDELADSDDELCSSANSEMDVSDGKNDESDNSKILVQQILVEASSSSNDRRSLPRSAKNKVCKSLSESCKLKNRESQLSRLLPLVFKKSSNNVLSGSTSSSRTSRESNAIRSKRTQGSGKTGLGGKAVYDNSNKPMHACEFCSAKFLFKHSLNVHIDYKHGGKRSRKCPFCEFTAVNNQLFVKHMVTHTKPVHEPESELDACTEFSDHLSEANKNTDSNLRRNQLHIHEVQNSTFCNEDDKTNVVYSLSNPMALKQNNSKKIMFGCQICGSKYSHKKDLKRHWLKKHKGQSSLFNELFPTVEKTKPIRTTTKTKSKRRRGKDNSDLINDDLNTTNDLINKVQDEEGGILTSAENTKEDKSGEINTILDAEAPLENNNMIYTTDFSRCNGKQDSTHMRKAETPAEKGHKTDVGVGSSVKMETADQKIKVYPGDQADVPDACCEILI